ncbi:MAG: hypothetical protein LBK82_14355 [Planctomycetaceae bacterium]|nr:hypothetical protein [Planctomycetaceae bacterium]
MGNPSAGRLRRWSLYFAVVNRVHSRLSPTQPFSERLPTYNQQRLSTFFRVFRVQFFALFYGIIALTISLQGPFSPRVFSHLRQK